MAGQGQEVGAPGGRHAATVAQAAAAFAGAAALIALAVLVVGGAGPAGAEDLRRLQAPTTTVPAVSGAPVTVPKITATKASVPKATVPTTTVPSIPARAVDATVPSGPVTVPNVTVPPVPVTVPSVTVPSIPVTVTAPGAIPRVPGAAGSPSGGAVPTPAGAQPSPAGAVPSSRPGSIDGVDTARRAGTERARVDTAGGRAHPATGPLAFRLGRAAADIVQQMAFPLGLMLAMLAFLVFQHRVDKNDPRVVAPFDAGDDDLLDFS